MHLTDYLVRNAKQMPTKTAVVFEGESLNWAELLLKVQLASANIAAEGLDNSQQQVVALLLPNSIDFVIAYLGILHTGHIAFPLDPAYKKLELDAIMEEIPPKILLSDANYRTQVSANKTKVVMADELLTAAVKPQNLLRLPADRQVASLTFTSGTTGVPKAVPNTHANHVWNVEVCSKVWQWASEDSLLISLPLSHWYGLVMGLSGAIYHGSTLYVLDQRFDPHKTLQLLSSGKVSFYTHISIMYLKLLEAKGSYDLSKLRLCVSGGAPLPPEVWRQFKSRFGVEILETYGTSETGRIAANGLNRRMPGSPGKILPGVNMKIGKDSEVLIKSPGVFPGYFHNRAATRAATTPGGYFRTGDIGELQDGYLYLKGRKQEQIRRFGYTISPRDIEWALHQHPDIKDIHVIGRQIKDQPNDELIYFIVSDLNEQAVRNYCKSNLLFAWRPSKIIYLKNLPRTHSGKPRLAEFKQLVNA